MKRFSRSHAISLVKYRQQGWSPGRPVSSSERYPSTKKRQKSNELICLENEARTLTT